MLTKSHVLVFIVLFGVVLGGTPDDSNQADNLNVNTVDTTLDKADNESRVIYGQKVAPRTYPFVCSLQLDYGRGMRSKFCAGTIIDRKWIVTAAHCFEDFTGNEQLKALCGSVQVDSTSTTYPGTQNLKIKRVISHPEYDPETTFNDIALLEVDGNIKFTQDVYPSCLPTPDHVPEEVGTGTIMGWGETETGKSSWHLLDANGIAINYKQCKTSAGWDLRSTQFCVTHPKSSVCGGDSGGPYIQYVEGHKRPCIVGIVSYGFPNCGQLPSVFTKVSEFLPFINQHVHK